MKRRNIKRMCAALLCLTFSLVACSEGAGESSQSVSLESDLSTSSSTVSTENSQSSIQSVGESASSSHPIPEYGPPLLDDGEEPSVTIMVKKSDLMSSQMEIFTDKETTEKILSFVETMFESDYKSPPSTGGSIIEVSITGKDGTTKEYSFLEDEVDGYGLAKDLQHPDLANTWYFADPGAFSYLQNLLQ